VQEFPVQFPKEPKNKCAVEKVKSLQGTKSISTFGVKLLAWPFVFMLTLWADYAIHSYPQLFTTLHHWASSGSAKQMLTKDGDSPPYACTGVIMACV
jgi:hypothetical protein